MNTTSATVNSTIFLFSALSYLCVLDCQSSTWLKVVFADLPFEIFNLQVFIITDTFLFLLIIIILTSFRNLSTCLNLTSHCLLRTSCTQLPALPSYSSRVLTWHWVVYTCPPSPAAPIPTTCPPGPNHHSSGPSSSDRGIFSPLLLPVHVERSTGGENQLSSVLK